MKRAAVLLAALALAGCRPDSTPPPKPTPVFVPAPTRNHSESATAVDAGDGIPCNDGTVSHTKHRKDACAGHGGIA